MIFKNFYILIFYIHNYLFTNYLCIKKDFLNIKNHLEKNSMKMKKRAPGTKNCVSWPCAY